MPRTVPEIAARVREGMAKLDTAPFADLFAADAVYELPFLGQRTEGREAIVAMLNAGGERARGIGVTNAQVDVTTTETGFVLELAVAGHPSSVGVVTVAGGEITAYRDYPNLALASLRTREVFDRFLAASVENRWDDLADLYAEDVTVEMPFTPAGVPRLTHGREELRRRFHAAAGVRRVTGAANVVVHGTNDPSVLVAEFDLHQELGGETFVASYVMVMTIENGLITHTRDYADTAASAERIKRFRESSPADSPAG
ncbi:Ketosteroid isomerase-related protein [Amycolatopsis pretoriensis]|uniref:Ketosteroid isomerase-related protein n=1 Tax=Amycolatopsis pretoriensis TaxID=218821 RepID=A0A1H5QXA2_9PSEU|nr:nuclear transport factor 2 family protein [Amycolatopsis pretoriensis]SEF30760.1 Ketosteroid isomerase-related protein [Amycolatopsis pretoriensis]